MVRVAEREIAGRILSIETGKLAEQASAAVAVRYGDTVVLVTACMGNEPRDVDFVPLLVDYEERLYAAGKIPGGFFRREGRPSEEAILDARLTDRSLRPLFPKDLRYDVHIVVTVLSADQENNPDILSVIGASAALSLSEIPWNGPISAMRMGFIDGEFVINPTYQQLAHSLIDIVVASNKEAVVMLEAGCKEAPEDIVMEAIRRAHEVNQEVIALQEELIRELAKPKCQIESKSIDPELVAAISQFVDERLPYGISWRERAERDALISSLGKEALERFGERYPQKDIEEALRSELRRRIREKILREGRRPDGRKLEELRPISCEVGLLPRTHGSGLFTRGGTQTLTITTLGTPGEEQLLDGLSPEESKRFMHHYNFPPFSTGEAKKIGAPGRREIGHGALVERALLPVIPSEEEFPYTIRLVSEVLSSNGSTSMSSTCSSSLSLMDAGVPLKRPVAGVAIGLIAEEDGKSGKCALLTDIEGIEDAFGDMDFKVAGTSEGITAIQMDLKIPGVGFEIIEEALRRAKDARLYILSKMSETLSASRPELSRYAPKVVKINIDPDKIRFVIGPGGRVIRSIIQETKATINIEENGTITIGGPSEEAVKKALERIENITRDVEVGTIYTGKVTRIVDYGAFVELFPGKEGFIHISELADYRVPRVEDVVKVGDEIPVMVTGIDHLGRIVLSRRAVYHKLSQIKGARITQPPKSPRGKAR